MHSFAGLLGALLLGCAAPAIAVPLLPPVPPECAASPFDNLSLVQYQAGVIGECRDDATRWSVDTPKANPQDVGPSLLRAEFSSMSTWRQPSMLGTLRLDWSGERGDDLEPSQRASFSLGGLLKLHRTLALQTHFGIERTEVQRGRAIVSGVWRPNPLGLLFAEWTGSEFGTESHRLGGRLWIVPRRLSLDFRLQHVPEEDGWTQQQIGLALSLPL